MLKTILRGGLTLAAFLFFYEPQVKAQQFELLCPAGSYSVNALQSFDNSTGRYRQNYCIDANGNVTSNQGGGISSPNPLTAFSTGNTGYLTPDDCGNATCTQAVSPVIRSVKWCYDGSSTGGTNFTSTKTATITNTALSSGIATITAVNTLAVGNQVTITGSTNGSGIFNSANWPTAAFNQINGIVLTASGTSFTIAINSTNVGSAADTGTVTASCANFVQADVGSKIGITTAGAGGGTLQTTIQTVTNGTTIVLASGITPGSLTNVKFWYGSDATTPVQNWAANISKGSINGNQTVHAGYLPRKFYYISQPVVLINPLVANTCCGPVSQGSPEPFINSNAGEGLSIVGTGGLSNGFVVDGAFNWNCSTVGANPMGVVYYKGWNGTYIANFAIIGDKLASMTLTGCSSTSGLGGLVSDSNAHENVVGVQVQGLHSTTGSVYGHVIQGICFESHFSLMTMYANDQNANYSGQPDQCTFDHMIWEGFNGTNVQGNVSFNTTAPQLPGNLTRITNSYIGGNGAGDGGNGSWELAFGATVNSDFVIENTEIFSVTANNLGMVTNASARGRLSFTNVTFDNTAAAGASTNLINNASNGNTVIVQGGQLLCNGTCANGVTNTSGSTLVFNGTKNGMGQEAFAGTGISAISAIFDRGAGVLGGAGGFISGSYQTLTNCAVNSVSPAACGSAASGAFVEPTGTTTYTVNTTAVTAASRITLTPMSFSGNLPSAPTCVVPTTPFIATVSAISAGTSFTITTPNTTGQTCWQYQIVN